MAYGVPDWMEQGQPQQRQGTPSNPLLTALAKGLVQGGTRGGNNSLMAQALRKAFASPGGDGITGSVGAGGVAAEGQGIGQAAQAAGQGTELVSAASGGVPALSDVSAGNVDPNFSAGGYLTNKGGAVDTGFGEAGGTGLQTSSTGEGLQVGQNSGFGYDATANNGAGEMTLNGKSSDSGGGSWASAATGALAGYNAGINNYNNDPNMRNHKDGFGTAHDDWRASIGGGTVGGLLGYYGGPVGSMLAGPVVQTIHPVMEQATRTAINAGDAIGDSAGATLMDPIGTAASGKYTWGQMASDALKYGALGGIAKFI